MAEKPVPPSVTAKDPEGVEFLSSVAHAYDEARLSKEEALYIDQPGPMQELRSLICSFISRKRHPVRTKGRGHDSSLPRKPRRHRVEPVMDS
jgi:hypothetical protein